MPAIIEDGSHLTSIIAYIVIIAYIISNPNSNLLKTVCEEFLPRSTCVACKIISKQIPAVGYYLQKE